MAITIRQLVEGAAKRTRRGDWLPTFPMQGPWIWRVRDAWLVLTGRAEAVVENE